MVSVTGLKALNAQNTLDLFKTQQQPATKAAVLTPSVDAGSGGHAKAIADLAAKLIDIKSGTGGDTSETERPPRIGDGVRPLSPEERATEKANWEAFYQAQDDAERTNWPQKVKDLLLQNELYSDDPSFQAALKNGTLEIEDGKTIGLDVAPREIVFDNNGQYAGVKHAGSVTDFAKLWDNVEYIDGKLHAKADGQNAAIGATGSMTFFVTWPKS
jgi:hypothetical protein